MKKKQTTRLSLAKKTISNLQDVKGGAEIAITTIGHRCSMDNTCARMSRRDAGLCDICDALSAYPDCITYDTNNSMLICAA